MIHELGCVFNPSWALFLIFCLPPVGVTYLFGLYSHIQSNLSSVS